MKKLIRPIVLVVAIVSGLAGVGYARPDLATNLGLDFWSVSELQESLDCELRLHRELEAKDVEVLRRIDIKEEIVRDLVANRLTLTEAAAHFKLLNAHQNAYLTVIRTVYVGASDDERICRNVIGFVEVYLQAMGQRGGPVLERLNAELKSWVDRGEPLEEPRLPEHMRPAAARP